MAGQARLFHELTRGDLHDLAPTALAVLPLGATEQHGPHLPVGTDALIVEHIARTAADAADPIPIVVAPTIAVGASHHHLPFGGTISLGAETYYHAVHDILASLVSAGFSRIFILNGHGGNEDLGRQVARDLALAHPVAIAAAAYWTIAYEPLSAACAGQGIRLPGHAGAFETALILALRPDLVAASRPHRERPAENTSLVKQPSYQVAAHGSWQAIDGYTDSPAQATAEAGRGYLELIVGAVAQAFRDFYAQAVIR